MVHNTENGVKKDAAIELADILGWQLLPIWHADGDRCGCGKTDCPSPAKHPIGKLVPSGLKDATSDLATIESWWSAYPDANIAARTGQEFWALDLDGLDGIRAFAQVADNHDDLPEVPTAQTGGGGRHLFFAPDGRVKNATKVGGDPVDTRGAGGYVCLPPSRHVSGNAYLWELPATKYELEAAPPWLVDYVTGANGSNGTGTKFTYQGDLATSKGASEGGRNNTLCQLVGAHLAERGVTADLMALAVAWGQRCRPPLDEKQVRKTVLALAEKHAKGAVGQPAEVVSVRYSEIAPERLSWLWEGRVAVGKLTVVAGDPGLGKSFLTLDLAARVSTGRAFPDGAACQRGVAIIVSCEDDPSDTIRPRLDSLGANVANVIHFEGIRADDGKVQPLQLDRHIPALDRFLADTEGASLLIVDPITGFMGSADDHRNAEVRAVLGPLAALAAKHRLAVVAVSHLSKSQGRTIYRTMGSLAYTAAARAVWAVVADPDDEERRLFLPVKNNLAPATGLAYRLVDGKVQWEEGAVMVAVDDIDHDAETPRKEAEAWLRQILDDGAVVASQILKRAKTDGINERTLRRAKKELRIRSEQFRDGWAWALPDKQKTEGGGNDTYTF